MNVEDSRHRGDAQKRWIVEGVESQSQRSEGARYVDGGCGRTRAHLFSPFAFFCGV